VIECDSAPSVELKHHHLLLRLRSLNDSSRKHALVDQWYRELVKTAASPLIEKWQARIGVNVQRFFVQRMKTKWGSCNTRLRSIRLNTDLARKPPEFLEYIVVHEMAHLVARHHNERFASLMDKHLPNWRLLRQALNDAPLAHAEWPSANGTK